MAKGNIGNLKPFTVETARENGLKGAIASAESKKRRKLLKEILLDKLDQEHYVNGIPVRKSEQMCDALLEKGIKGDLEAIKLIRDTIGEKPREMVHMAGGLDFNAGGLAETLAELRKKD